MGCEKKEVRRREGAGVRRSAAPPVHRRSRGESLFPFLVSTSKSTSTRMCSVQDSVLPRGVGLRKPHIFSFPLPPYSLHLSPSSSLRSPYYFYDLRKRV